IDYSQKNDDGSVAKVPDSLKSEFRTASGRVVYDGGGIEPDIEVKTERLALITGSLLKNEIIFDFATGYRSKHDTIVAVKDFIIPDEVFNDFVEFIKDKDYDYTSKSEDMLDKLKESAKKEMYYDAIEDELVALKEKIAHDKQLDIQKHKEEIRSLIKQEIVSRYYYQNGRIKAGLEDDPDVKAALKLFNDPAKYVAILDNTIDTGNNKN
ncbi:MAG: peptidase S41, partial [Bacteroidetes bacterium]|nr:peptidase S41 [Bacteroidota bacterium]